MSKPYTFEPLSITAYLRCGVVSDATLPLDGVLYYQQMRSVYGAQDYTTPGDGSAAERTPISHLPLRIINYGTPQWYYAASFAQWPEAVAEGQDHWNKRFDASLIGLLDGSKKRVLIGEGRFRSYHMPVFYRHALWVRWYLVGRRTQIAHLLSMITHLGKKVDQGWGRVARWEIEPAAEDWSVYGPDGQPMRAIPSQHGTLHSGFRPSYWDPRNQALCTVPALTTAST